MTRAAAVALLLALSLPARAEPPKVLDVEVGATVPAQGVWLRQDEGLRILKECRAAEVERDELRKALVALPPTPATSPTGYVIVGGVALLAGFVAGVVAAVKVLR